MAETVRVSSVPSIAIFVHHKVGCKYPDDELSKRCKCSKHPCWTYGGKQYRRSANTRSWTTAEEARRKVEAQFEEPKPTGAVTVKASSRQTIDRAIELFVSDKRSQKVSSWALKKYELELKRLQTFLTNRLKHFPAEITLGDLTEFRATWDELYLSSMTRKVQERLRGFLRYCYESRLIDRVPKLSLIKVDEPQGLPRRMATPNICFGTVGKVRQKQQ